MLTKVPKRAQYYGLLQSYFGYKKYQTYPTNKKDTDSSDTMLYTMIK